MTRVLAINASGRHHGSLSRTLSADLINALETHHGDLDVVTRDLADGVGFVNEAWIDAAFTDPDDHSDAQKSALAESDALVAELQAADVVVIATPIYNFGVPASLKAWFDQVARARVTFAYTDKGPVGLLDGKQAYLLVVSGGVDMDSPADFATPWLRQVLTFIGIDDITSVGARQNGREPADVLDKARADIAERVHTAPQAA
ncbi:MAG: NAD(P)H-dependent oxidoreductase [Pseudomonadota bacterium]